MNAHTAQLKNAINPHPEDGRTPKTHCDIQMVRSAMESSVAPATGKSASWARQRARIRNACSAYSQEEISLYECMAMSHGECR
jgi:hypothetical protein